MIGSRLGVGYVFDGIPFFPEGIGDLGWAGVDMKEVGGGGHGCGSKPDMIC